MLAGEEAESAASGDATRDRPDDQAHMRNGLAAMGGCALADIAGAGDDIKDYKVVEAHDRDGSVERVEGGCSEASIGEKGVSQNDERVADKDITLVGDEGVGE